VRSAADAVEERSQMLAAKRKGVSRELANLVEGGGE
jgi:hypothetical protein